MRFHRKQCQHFAVALERVGLLVWLPGLLGIPGVAWPRAAAEEEEGSARWEASSRPSQDLPVHFLYRNIQNKARLAEAREIVALVS